MENKAIYKEIGKTLAPMELEGENPMEMLEGQEGEFATIRVGWKNVRVFLVPADREFCEEMMQMLNRKYSKDYRESRCLVPGIYKDFVRCRESNRCEECPYGKDRESFNPQEITYEEYLSMNLNTADPSGKTEFTVELEDMFLEIERENPVSLKALKMNLAGYRESEIAGLLHISPAAVHRALNRAHSIARRYRDRE